jgi:cellulose synthase/poly-beta-1,6-N-acetylglucosamine synthase-like glycosyltransferase
MSFEKRKRSIKDNVICFFNNLRFYLLEPILLNIARLKHQRNYDNIEESPLISITIPTYDRGQLIVDRTLPSILSQSYQNFEILIKKVKQ